MIRTLVGVAIAALWTVVRVDAQWISSTGATTERVLCFVVKGSTVFAGTSNGVYRTTDDGATWEPVNSGLTDLFVFALSTSQNFIFAGTQSGIFRTTDDGLSWSQFTTNGLPHVGVQALVAHDSSLFAGTWGNGVYRSTDDGSNWIQVNNGLTRPFIMSMASIGVGLFSAAWGGAGIYWSTNEGASWNASSGLGENKETKAIGGNESLMIAVTNSGVYRSTNFGRNWSYANLIDSTMTSMIVNGSIVLIGSEWGVNRSTDGGLTWQAENAGLTSLTVTALGIGSSHVFAGIMWSGIWRRASEGFASAVEMLSQEIPERFVLEQNYPNPFNPRTVINYQIPISGRADLRVYDLLGKEVAVLVDKDQLPGAYKVTWDASGLATGVYLYRLQASGFVETKRLLLLR